MTAQSSTYLDRAITNELSILSSGTGSRNTQLFKSAAALYRFAEAGVMDETDLTQQLADAGSDAGLSKLEIRDTLKSARRRAASIGETTRQEIRAKCNGERTTYQASQRDPAPPEACDPPNATWRQAGSAFVLWCQSQWADDARAYLHSRGLTDKTIAAFTLGYNPAGRWSERAKWGLEPESDGNERLWLPAGIVIPEYYAGALWRIEIRQDKANDPGRRYKTVTGSSNVLAGADSIQAGKPAMLVEGPMDWLAVAQAAGDLVGIGRVGTTGARRVRWLTLLALCSDVMIGLDADAAGDEGSAYWLDALPNARRWRPYYADPSQMLQDGQDVRGWVLAGLRREARVHPVASEFRDFWLMVEERGSTEHIERHKALCTKAGTDYQATIETLKGVGP
jgi:hypothetical protein